MQAFTVVGMLVRFLVCLRPLLSMPKMKVLVMTAIAATVIRLVLSMIRRLSGRKRIEDFVLCMALEETTQLNFAAIIETQKNS